MVHDAPVCSVPSVRARSQAVPVGPCPIIRCQDNAGPSASVWKVPAASASVQVCKCWSQFPAGAAGVRVAPVLHSCSLPRTVPAPSICWMIPGLGARAMLDLDPGSQQGSRFTRLVPSSWTSASWRRSHFPLPGGSSPRSQSRPQLPAVGSAGFRCRLPFLARVPGAASLSSSPSRSRFPGPFPIPDRGAGSHSRCRSRSHWQCR